jgi:ribosomal protein S18 acetylase RimI-like enzyme
MTQSEYAVWLAETIPAYAADKVASGQWAEDAALELSKKEYGELLPQGPETPENHLFTILDKEAVPVGVLWFAVKTKFNARIAFVLDVSVAEGRRRQGHARRALLALEDEVHRLGLSGIALHVFGHNTGAQALYAKLGYRPTNISLFKPIGLTGDMSDCPTSHRRATDGGVLP